MRENQDHTPSYGPVKRAGQRAVAVAVRGDAVNPDGPGEIVASGRGKIAEEILDIAYTNGVRVREDGPLAEILAQLELDTPIPSEAIVAVAEILAKVYEANAAAAPAATPADLKGPP